MANTLAELQERPRKRARPAYPNKPCRFCRNDFTPRSGMAALKRSHCYEPSCEDAHDKEHSRIGWKRSQERSRAQGK